MAPSRTWEGNTDLLRLLVPVDQLRRHPANPRRGDMDAIRASLRRFGQQRPVLALPDGTIVAGNHTFQATVDEGWTHCAVVRSDLTDAEVDAYLAADNRTGDLGTYDDEVLARLLQPLYETDRLLGTGYDDGFVERLVARVDAPRPDADDAPPLPAEAKSALGAVYELGPHRLVCGDATDRVTVEEALQQEHADLVVTDPPYGVDIQERDMAQAEVQGRRKDGKGVLNDDLDREELGAFLRAAFTAARFASRPGACWYVFAPSGVDYRYSLNELDALGVARHGLVWVKDRFVMGRADYHYRHENIVYGWTPGAAHHAPAVRDLDSVLEHARPGASPEHPTMKPVGLIEGFVLHSSEKGDRVLDPFAGSGTTLIACENLGRRAALVELDPRYCDVIRQRYADYVGDQTFAP